MDDIKSSSVWESESEEDVTDEMDDMKSSSSWDSEDDEYVTDEMGETGGEMGNLVGEMGFVEVESGEFSKDVINSSSYMSVIE